MPEPLFCEWCGDAPCTRGPYCPAGGGFLCTRCHQTKPLADADVIVDGFCAACVRAIMADPPGFKPDAEAADPYWGPG